MSRRYNIKWRESDDQALRKAVRNYNAKISRIEKSDPLYKGIAPERVSLKEIKAGIQTRQDLNRQIKDLQTFTQRGGEYRYNWNARDDRRLEKAIKDFNAQVSKAVAADKKNAAAYPDRVTVTQLKKIISTKDDLNAELESLRRFSRKGAQEIVTAPGNKYNLKLTAWQRDDMLRRAENINKEREIRRQKLFELDMTSRGKKLGYKRGELGLRRAEEMQLEPINAFTDFMTRHDLKSKLRTLRRESMADYWNMRDEILRKNYIETIEREFARNDIDVSDIVDAIKNMDFAEFRKTFDAEGGTFEMLYPDKEKLKAFASELRATWNPNRSAATK